MVNIRGKHYVLCLGYKYITNFDLLFFSNICKVKLTNPAGVAHPANISIWLNVECALDTMLKFEMKISPVINTDVFKVIQDNEIINIVIAGLEGNMTIKLLTENVDGVK